MTVLVTGASGYLGRHVVCHLVDQGRAVVALQRGKDGDFGDGVAVACADLRDKDALMQVFHSHEPEAVIHCAAAIPREITVTEEVRSEADNLDATRTLLAVAARHTTRRIVFASTISVYTGDADVHADVYTESSVARPEGFYGRHKLAAEAMCDEWRAGCAGRSCVILRFAGLHGAPRKSGVVHAFIARALEGEPISVSAPQSRYSLLNVDDAAVAALLAVDRPSGPSFRVFNVAGDEPCDLATLAAKVLTLCGSRSPIAPGDGEPRYAVMAIDAAREELGFAPTPLEVWLQREIDQFVVLQ
ncbi:MAG: hypothetical protein CL569_20430 [Alphaproteobacteria bacterium]|nr:hypothetical protein [Alphaproteobacteria bacterium]